MSGSRVIRRSWWASVSFSHFFVPRWPIAVGFGQVPIEQLVDRGLGPWVAPLIDLIEQSNACFLCLFLGLGAGGDGLDQVVPTPRDGVDARVHAHSECAVVRTTYRGWPSAVYFSFWIDTAEG